MVNPRVAIVHDFLFQFGGAEKVVEKLLEMYPEATLYTSFAIPEKFQSSLIFQQAFENGQIKTTTVQSLFDKKDSNGNRILSRFQKHLFWLYPFLMRMVTVQDYDVVIISSTDCAKQIRIKNCKKIIHYCHAPTRYLHGLASEANYQNLSKLLQLLLPVFIFILKPLDLNAVKYLNSKGCIWFGNSEFIVRMIKEKYNTDAEVFYPPVNTDIFLKNKKNSEVEDSFYLCHGRISFHKRIDLAISACLELNKKLKISGTSALEEEMDSLKKIVSDYEVKYPDKTGLIEFLGRTDDKLLLDLFSDCKALIFPGKEDFGITPIEVLASGTPVIAFGEGGALEYIFEGKNGILFNKQTKESLIEAIENFEKRKSGLKKLFGIAANNLTHQYLN
jgi:glycosyltransferase involved in cell wall biosynthesis